VRQTLHSLATLRFEQYALHCLAVLYSRHFPRLPSLASHFLPFPSPPRPYSADSLGMVVLGHDDTTQVTMADMLRHCQAASKGVKQGGRGSPMLLGDLPFASYTSPALAVKNACRLVSEGRVDAVKLEVLGPRLSQHISACLCAARFVSVFVSFFVSMCPSSCLGKLLNILTASPLTPISTLSSPSLPLSRTTRAGGAWHRRLKPSPKPVSPASRTLA